MDLFIDIFNGTYATIGVIVLCCIAGIVLDKIFN